jgi:glycosyltransferase involved in cell wall biosynthesis
MPLRVLMMADTPADPNRGAAGTEMRTAQALRALGHEVRTIWSDELGRRIAHGNLHLLLELPRTYERAVRTALASAPYDVVHVNQPHGYLAARAVHALSPTTAFIHRSHGLELNAEETLAPWRSQFDAERRSVSRRLASRMLAPLLARHSSLIAREADGHIVSSSLDGSFLEKRLGVDPNRIAVIAQAAPDDYLRSPAPPMTDARLARVLHVSQFAFFKAPMITIEAIERLDCRVTWVCDRAHHETIRGLATKDANDRLTLLHWTTQEELRSLYDEHGVFLFPSFFEGFGKAFLEAMSRGCVVIATDAGGMRDVIRDGVDGRLIPAGDAGALASSTRAVQADGRMAAAMSAAAATTARQYSWSRFARELTNFYEFRIQARRASR